MATKKHTTTGLIPGHATHTRTQETYMGALLDAVSLDDWREVVTGAVQAAKGGDPQARNWLGQYLIGRPESKADMLQQRDREADDRRSCLECSNLTGHGRTWNCRAARQRGARGAGLPVDYTQMLTRCNAWMAQQGRL